MATLPTYYDPDYTGSLTQYLKSDIPVYLYKAGQIVSFKSSPIFADTLVITTNNGVTLVEGQDYTIPADAENDDATSLAFLYSPSFSRKLIDYVVITNALSSIAGLTYQEFYRTSPGDYFGSGEPYEVTADTILSLVAQTGRLNQLVTKVGSSTSISTDVPTAMDEDINETNPNNKVSGEQHQVNTVTGIKYILPVNGPFFRDSVVLTDGTYTLVEGTDYQVDNFDRQLTERSSNTSGIYRAIMLITARASTVSLSYHPVGGQITAQTLTAMWDRLVSITDYLNSGDRVTTDSLPYTPAFQSIYNYLEKLDTDMRRLLSTPTYTDATAGSSVQKIFQASDTSLHWYTIASLYKVTGSTTITLADCFHGRIFFPTNNVSCEFTVDVNLNNPNNKASFTTQSLVTDTAYSVFSNATSNTPTYPLFRLAWVQSAEITAGLVLQVGIALPTLSDSPIIEDMSSSESCWLLDKNQPVVSGAAAPSAIAPQDSGFTLPDGASIWGASGDTASTSVVFAPTIDAGYPVYVGSKNVTDLTISASAWQPKSLLPSYFPIAKVKRLKFLITNTAGTVTTVEVPMFGKTDTQRNGIAPFIADDNTVIPLNVSWFTDSTGASTFSIQMEGNVSVTNDQAIVYILAEV